MLNVIPILATKKIATKYIYKIKLRRNLNISSQKLTKHKRREECKKNEGQKKLWSIWKTNSKMTEVSPSLAVITLNVTWLNSPNKRQRPAEWTKTHDPTIHCLQETHLRFKDKNRFKVKRWKKYSMKIVNQRRTGVVMLM